MNDKKLKLSFVVGSLRMGGAERMMINLANQLSKQTEVTVIQMTKGSDLIHELDPSLHIFSFSGRRTLGAFLPLIKYLKKAKPDVLISTQIHVNILCMLAVLISGQRLKVILREATTPGIHFSLNKSLRTSITRKLMKWLYPKADAVVVNADAVLLDLIENKFASQEKISMIYNPVITENFRNMLQENISHPFFGVAPVFISVGRLAKAKNYSLLIHAFAKVLEKMDARLVIIGEGVERKSLEATISEMKLEGKINLTGQLKNPYPLMRRADVFVLSSGYEGLPNSLIEAMACGTQVVSTDCSGGSREILLDGKLGSLVPVNDAGALAGAMVNALDMRVSKADLIKSSERFETETVASQYFSLIEKVCNV